MENELSMVLENRMMLWISATYNLTHIPSPSVVCRPFPSYVRFYSLNDCENYAIPFTISGKNVCKFSLFALPFLLDEECNYVSRIPYLCLRILLMATNAIRGNGSASANRKLMMKPHVAQSEQVLWKTACPSPRIARKLYFINYIIARW